MSSLPRQAAEKGDALKLCSNREVQQAYFLLLSQTMSSLFGRAGGCPDGLSISICTVAMHSCG